MRGKAPYTFYRSRDGAESASAAGGVKSNGQMSEILFPLPPSPSPHVQPLTFCGGCALDLTLPFAPSGVRRYFEPLVCLT